MTAPQPPRRSFPPRPTRPAADPALRASGSAYLLSGCELPVAWKPWGKAAFQEAAERRCPVLLTIGAAWCAASHRMDLDCYGNLEIAARINEAFVPVRVDRDAHPPLARRYQAAAVALGAQATSGGEPAPITAFLTPGGHPFLAGTYFAPEAQGEGQTAFGDVLDAVAKAYLEQGPALAEQAERLMAELARAERAIWEDSRGEGPSGRSDTELREVLNGVCRGIAADADARYGGLAPTGEATGKTPPISAIELALACGTRPGLLDPTVADPQELWRFAQNTLFQIVEGGIHDHVGGGFHLSSADERWQVPSFEKTAMANAEFLRVLTLIAADPRREGPVPAPAIYLRAIRGTVRYLTKTLCDRAGGFYCAQAAQSGFSNPGQVYTWTLAELEDVLSAEELEAMTLRFGLQAEPGHLPGIDNSERNVLAARLPVQAVAARLGADPDAVAARVDTALDALRVVRSSRSVPFIDTALYTNVQGAVARALLCATSAGVLEPEAGRRAAAAALKAIDRVLEEGIDSRAGAAGSRLALVHRLDAEGSERCGGLLEDHAWMAAACTEAFAYTSSAKYLDAVLALAEQIHAAFADERTGALLEWEPGASGVGAGESSGNTPLGVAGDVPPAPVADATGPSPVTLTAQIYARLADMTGDSKQRDRARRLAEALAVPATLLGPHAAGAALALAAAIKV